MIICMCDAIAVVIFFFFNDTATTEIYTLSLHDALPISSKTARRRSSAIFACRLTQRRAPSFSRRRSARSEEHTSELQSRQYLVCRLLLEKKKITQRSYVYSLSDAKSDDQASEITSRPSN